MKNCVRPEGHEWTPQVWVEYDHTWWNEGFFTEEPEHTFCGKTSQMVHCLHCGETGYLIKDLV